MRFRYLLAVIFVLLILGIGPLSITGKIAELEISRGEMFGVSIYPIKPLFGEETEISIGIKNTASTENDYKLVYRIIKDGVVKHTSDRQFTLFPSEIIKINPTIILNDLGSHLLIIELFDKAGVKLFDTITKTFDVVSEIGPFDLRLDLPTSIIQPGGDIPVILTIINLGEKETQVNVNVNVNCYDKSDIQDEFSILLGPKVVTEKIVNVAACKETGLHEVSASIVHLNRTWIAAVNQLYLQESFLDISYDTPPLINGVAGQPASFNIVIKNIGEDTIHNLKVLIEKIPSEWINIDTPLVAQLESGKTAFFYITITIPYDLKPQNVTSRITIAADEGLIRKELELNIAESTFPTGPPPPQTIIPVDEGKKEASLKFTFSTAIIVIISILIMTLVVVVLIVELYGKKPHANPSSTKKPIVKFEKQPKSTVKKEKVSNKPEKQNALRKVEKAYEEGLISKEIYLKTKNKFLKERNG